MIKFKRQTKLPVQNHQELPLPTSEEMDREYFHWGATTEIMEIIRRRKKSPELRRFVERRLEIARPGMMRRRYDQNAQGTIWVPSRANKRSREEIAEIDGELIQTDWGGEANGQSKKQKTNRNKLKWKNNQRKNE